MLKVTLNFICEDLTLPSSKCKFSLSGLVRVHRLLGEQDWEGSRRSREGELEGLDPREVRDTLEGTDQSFSCCLRYTWSSTGPRG